MSSRFRWSALLAVLSATFACGSTKRDFAPAESSGGAGASGNAGRGSGDGGEPSSGGSGNAGAGHGVGGASAGQSGASSGGEAGMGGEAGALAPTCGAPGIACCDGNTCDTGASCKTGICACNTGLSDCSARCVDLKADAKNCGSCGHGCLGGTCDLDTCEPVTIVPAQSSPQQIATDGTYVYWSAASYIARRRVDGSDDVKQIAIGEMSTHSLALAGGNVYWIAGGHLRVCDAPNCSKGPADVISTVSHATCSGGAGGMLYFSPKQTLFWSCSADYAAVNGTLWSLPLVPAPPTTALPSALGTNPSSPASLASDDTNLYWINTSYVDDSTSGTDGGIWRARLSDGVTTSLVSGVGGNWGYVTVGGGALYFSAQLFNSVITVGPNTYGIFRVPLPGGLGTTFPPKFGNGNYTSGVVADDDAVYFTDATAGTISRCPHVGCAAVPTIVSGESTPGQMIQDAVSVYWLTGTVGGSTTGTIRRLAK